MNKPNRALSIRQPYAEMILLGEKKVEKRSKPTKIRERVYIYASKKPGKKKAFKKLKVDRGALPVGVLVGTVEITGCTKKKGEYRWRLAEPERLPKPLEPENQPQPKWFFPFKEKIHSISQFRRAIRRLPADEPVVDPKVGYKTQKKHWLGWLKEYDGPGAYGRLPGQERDARFAYNHIVNYQMLLWIIEAAGVSSDLVTAARGASENAKSLQQKSAAIRKLVPWEVLAEALWAKAEKE